MRDGERASEMGWLHPIGRGQNHIARQAMSRSLISAQKTNGDPEIAMEMGDGNGRWNQRSWSVMKCKKCTIFEDI